MFAYFQWDKRGDLSVTTIFSDDDGKNVGYKLWKYRNYGQYR